MLLSFTSGSEFPARLIFGCDGLTLVVSELNC